MLQLLDTNPQNILNDFMKKLKEEYNEEIFEGDKRYMFLSTLSYIISVLNAKSNLAFNQNFLTEAYGIGLDIYGANLNTPRLGSTKSVVKVKFTLAQERPNDYIIPKGTRVTTPTQQIFETKNEATILQGDLSIEVDCQSIGVGSIYNDIPIGGITQLVDPLAFMQGVTNTTVSSGGSDPEGDEAYRQRLKIAESQFSVAGSVLAYKYWTLKADPLIIDALITTPNPGEVDIKPILQGGELPQEVNLERVRNMFNQNTNYPNTTRLTISTPEVLEYDIDLTYYINKDNKQIENELKIAIEKAVEDFIVRQKTNLNIYLNPDDLRKMLLNAGAYTVNITNPTFDKSASGKLTRVRTKNVSYGGLL